MTTQSDESRVQRNGAVNSAQEEPRAIETLADLVALGAELSAKIPEDVRKKERARMVAYLDEVAAREPSRPTERR